MIGKKIKISGMLIEVIADKNQQWEIRNVTTNEIIFMDKHVLERAIKLGMAEISEENKSDS